MQIGEFIAEYGDVRLRHCDELLAALRSGACELDACSEAGEFLPASHYRRIFEVRVESLRTRRLASPLALAVLADSDALLQELERLADEPCRVWNFSLPPHDSFGVYEALRSRVILGCIRGVDRRRVDEPTWHRLWHEA